MDAKEFFFLVKDMREQQKAFFKTRSGVALVNSMSLEARVDAEIERTLKVIQKRWKRK